jgi:hypothetical protein
MEVSVTKTPTGYTIQIGERTVTLPLASKMTTTSSGIAFGVPSKRLEVETYANEIDLVKGKGEPSESILSEDDADDETREAVVLDLTTALSDQAGSSRVNRKTRRSKGKRRNTKRNKLRKLTSRRR